MIRRYKSVIAQLTFSFSQKDAHEEEIEIRVQNGTVWLTQKAIPELFDIDRSVVNKHLKNIYESGAAPEDVAEVIAELLSELQDISDDKALTAAGYFHTKSNRTLRKNAK